MPNPERLRLSATRGTADIVTRLCKKYPNATAADRETECAVPASDTLITHGRDDAPAIDPLPCPFGCVSYGSDKPSVQISALDGNDPRHWRVVCPSGCSGPWSYISRDYTVGLWNSGSTR